MNVVYMDKILDKLHDSAPKFFKMISLPIYLEEMARSYRLLSTHDLGDWLIIWLVER